MNLPRSVYAIQHNVTKRIYVGSSCSVPERYWSHVYKLRSGKHSIADMQEDFNKYGEDYSLFILDEIKDYSERIKEYEWMVKLESYIRGKGYNYKDRADFQKILGKRLPLKSGIPKTMKEDVPR